MFSTPARKIPNGERYTRIPGDTFVRVFVIWFVYRCRRRRLDFIIPMYEHVPRTAIFDCILIKDLLSFRLSFWLTLQNQINFASSATVEIKFCPDFDFRLVTYSKYAYLGLNEILYKSEMKMATKNTSISSDRYVRAKPNRELEFRFRNEIIRGFPISRY